MYYFKSKIKATSVIILSIVVLGLFWSTISRDTASLKRANNSDSAVVRFEVDGNEARNLDEGKAVELFERIEVCTVAEADIPFCYGKTQAVDAAIALAIKDKNIIAVSSYSIAAEKMTEYRIHYDTTVKLLRILSHDMTAYAIKRDYPDRTETFTVYDAPWYMRWLIWHTPQKSCYLALVQNMGTGARKLATCK